MRTLGFRRGAIGILLFGQCAEIGIVGGGIGAGLAYRLFAGGRDAGTGA